MNEVSLEYRAAKVSLVTGLSTVLAAGFQLISVPVCLHYWGKEAYGGWLALLSAFMLLRSLDGGYVVYVGNKLNSLYHRDRSALSRHLSSAAFGIVAISCLQLALAVSTFIFEPLSAALGMAASTSDGIVSKFGLLTLMTSWVLSGSYLGIVHRLLIPVGRMYQAAWWAMGFQVCQFGSIMAAAILNLDLLRTSLLFAAAQMLIYVTSALYVRRVLPEFTPWVKSPDMRIGFSDLGDSLFLTTSNLIQQSSTNGVVLVIAALSGSVAVPVFTTVRTLTNLWTSMTTVLSAPLLPDVVRIHARNETGKLVALNKAYWVIIGAAVNLGALLSYPLIPDLYGRWTAHVVDLDNSLLCFLLGSVILANAGALMALHLNGINSVRIVLAVSVIRAALGLGVGALSYGQLGLAGFGLGIFLGEVAATLCTAFYFVRHEVTAKGSRMRCSDFGPVSMCAGSAAVFFVGGGFGWWSVGLVWVMAIIGVVVATVWGWMTLEQELRSRLKIMVLRVVGR